MKREWNKMRPKKIPQRMCVGCQQMKPKKELVRIVKNKDGEIKLDLTGKAQGRGAYICKSVNCLEAAFKSKRFEKTFESNIPEEVYESLRKEISE